MNLRRLSLLASPLRKGCDLPWVGLLIGMIVSPGYVALSDSDPSLVTLEERAVKNAVAVVADSVVQVSTIGGQLLSV